VVLLSLALAASALAAYLLVPSVMIHGEEPWPAYALLAGSVVAAAASRRRGWVRRLTIAATAIVSALFVFFNVGPLSLDPGGLAVRPGDPFPELTLPTSTGATFFSRDLAGRSAALYIFYRGDW
jgi:hypothetical protein